MEGGSANDYDYCSGDSVNCMDLTGLEDGIFHGPVDMSPRDRRIAECAGPDEHGADISGSAHCGRVAAAATSGDFSDFGVGFVPRTARCPGWLVWIVKGVGVGDVGRAVHSWARRDFSRQAATGAATSLESFNVQNFISYGLSKGGLLAKYAGTFIGFLTPAATAIDAGCAAVA